MAKQKDTIQKDGIPEVEQVSEKSEPVKSGSLLRNPFGIENGNGATYINGVEVKFEIKNFLLETSNPELIATLEREGWLIV